MPQHNLDTIDGVAVVARATAQVATPLTKGVPADVKGVDEVLLADERTVYQCVQVPVTECGLFFETAISARAHLVKHSAKRELARQRTAEAEEAARRSNGTKAGHDARQQRIKTIREKSLAATLIELATELESQAMLLRAAAQVAKECEATPAVSSEELKALRGKAAAYDTIQQALKPLRN